LRKKRHPEQISEVIKIRFGTDDSYKNQVLDCSRQSIVKGRSELKVKRGGNYALAALADLSQ